MTKVKDSKVTLSATALYNNTISFTLGTEYQHNGKEKMQHLYDYGARRYYPSIGRFIGVDPLAEKFPHISVYNYAGNSPIGNIDLWGLQKVDYRYLDLTIAEGMEGDLVENYDKVQKSGPENQPSPMRNRQDITPALKQVSSGVGLAGNISGHALSLTKYTKVTKVMKGLGVAGSIGGIGLDVIGVNRYFNKGPNAPGAVSPSKAGFNVSVALYGFFGGIGGAMLSSIYFGFEAFYPGGFGQALKDKAHRDAKVRDAFRKATGNSSLQYNSIGPYDGIDH